MPSWTLCVLLGRGRTTRSVEDGIPTRSVGTSAVGVCATRKQTVLDRGLLYQKVPAAATRASVIWRFLNYFTTRIYGHTGGPPGRGTVCLVKIANLDGFRTPRHHARSSHCVVFS